MLSWPLLHPTSMILPTTEQAASAESQEDAPLSSWIEHTSSELAEALAARSARSAGEHVGLVPVGAIEQHGPHLPVGTDTIVATALCDRAGPASGALVLPAISIGVSYGHGTVLPGTLSLSPELLVEIVHSYVRWAAVSGLRRLLFVNAHFGNAASLTAATDKVRLYAPDLRIGIVDWWSVDPGVLAHVTADGDDIHANAAETSIMLALAPHLVRMDAIADADDEDRTADLVFRYTAPALSRNGVTGRPSQATAEAGNALVDQVVAAIVSRVERGRTEEPPLGAGPRATVCHLARPARLQMIAAMPAAWGVSDVVRWRDDDAATGRPLSAPTSDS